MIKYSRAGTASIPHERVFKLDSNNLVCIYIFALTCNVFVGASQGFWGTRQLAFLFLGAWYMSKFV